MWELRKTGDENFLKTSAEVGWVEFNESGMFKEKHDTPKIATSLLMSPFNVYFTWQTTLVKEIISVSEERIHFRTENSEYELRFTGV